MNNKFLSICICACAFLGTFAQNYDVITDLKRTPLKICGEEGAYRFDAKPLTPAPKGYKPFYLTHYGRHGSRYAWNSKTYSQTYEILTLAYQQGVLTELGKDFYNKFSKFYFMPLINTGDLTELGWEQHNKIAEIMIKEFPQIFKGNAKISAIVSNSSRANVSMTSFLLKLKECNPKLQITARSLHTDLPYTCTSYAPTAIKKHYKGDPKTPNYMSTSEFQHKHLDYDGILSRFFTDLSFIKKSKLSRTDFIINVAELVAGYHNYEKENLFDDLLTTEQLIQVWECRNYNSFKGHVLNKWKHIPVLEDILNKADLAIQGRGNQADLRFGHDHVFSPVMALLNINKSGMYPPTEEDVKYWSQNYNIPMAANLQFILYRAKGKDILFKVLLNGQEVELSDLTPVQGPYYRWSDFTAWANRLMEAHPVEK